MAQHLPVARPDGKPHEIERRVKSSHPEVTITQLKVSHPADDDGIWFFRSREASTFWRRMLSSKTSATRMPVRLILSAYVGPMPRPVVPILRLPRNRSVTLSIVRL